VRLNELKPAPGSVKRRKRVGRGLGSGHGKTSTRGSKGDKARGSVRPGFEGGQTPLHRRLPQKRGFTNIFKKEYAIINLDLLAKQPEDTITPELLLEKGIIKDVKGGLRVLGRGELERAITVRAHHFSKAAEEKIKAKGGAAEVIE
jgi:large subunit ribosomal protein L15